MTNVENLIEASMHYLQDRPDEWSWAWEELTVLVDEQPELAWQVITTLVGAS